MKIYAAYGSNMNINQMSKRCPAAKIYITGTIEGYELVFRGRGHANIIKNKSASTPVVLWQITKACEKELDKYEELGSYYIKENINVLVKDNIMEAFVYVMTDSMNEKKSKPTDAYFNTIKDGYIDNNLDYRPLETNLKR